MEPRKGRNAWKGRDYRACLKCSPREACFAAKAYSFLGSALPVAVAFLPANGTAASSKPQSTVAEVVYLEVASVVGIEPWTICLFGRSALGVPSVDGVAERMPETEGCRLPDVGVPWNPHGTVRATRCRDGASGQAPLRPHVLANQLRRLGGAAACAAGYSTDDSAAGSIPGVDRSHVGSVSQ